jgi:MoxR-like ATPase
MEADRSRNGDIRNIFWEIYGYINDHLYWVRPDLEVDNRACNAALLLGLLTALGRGRALIIGEPGLGKTTSAEYASALVHRIPLDVIWRAEVSGHPEQTEEKMIGRPDLGALNQGREEVVWTFFTLLPAKIVDEINRLPETKQSLILDGVDRGKWEYLNEAVVNPDTCFFATANYADQGTHTIVAPLMDRFDVMVESKHPGASLAYRVGARGGNHADLRDPETEAEWYRRLRSAASPQERLSSIRELGERFGDVLHRRLGLRTLSESQREAARQEAEALPLELDANAFMRLVLAELSFCHRYGQKRSHEACEEGCHFSAYLCHAMKNCISNRFSISALHYARLLAWALGSGTVDVEHLKAVLPFAMAHRVRWREKTVAECDGDIRRDPLPIHMARKAAASMHRRYVEQAHRIKEALQVACRIAEGEDEQPLEGDHPLFWDIRRDLNLPETHA